MVRPYEDIERHLGSDDPTTVLLKGHLWIEGLLEDIIAASVTFPEALPKVMKSLNFPAKVALADAVAGILWPQPILKLNSVRNTLAHDVTFEPTMVTAREILGSFPSDFGEFDVPEELAQRPDISECDTAADALRAIFDSLLGYLMRVNVEALRVQEFAHRETMRRINEMIEIHSAARPEVDG